MSEPGTVTAQLEELERRGFDANFGVVGNAVQVLNGGKTFKFKGSVGQAGRAMRRRPG